MLVWYTVILQISPHCGSVLGGTPVKISGPQFEEEDKFTCLFDSMVVEGNYLNTNFSLCVSPQFKKIGRIILNISVMWTNGTTKYESQTSFYSGMC